MEPVTGTARGASEAPRQARRTPKHPKNPTSSGAVNDEAAVKAEASGTSGTPGAAAAVPLPVPGSADAGATKGLVPASVVLAKKRPKKVKSDTAAVHAMNLDPTGNSTVGNAKSTGGAGAGAVVAGSVPMNGNPSGSSASSTSTSASTSSCERSQKKKQSAASGAVSSATQNEIARTLNAAAAAFVPPPPRTSSSTQAAASSAPTLPVSAVAVSESSKPKPKPKKSKKSKTVATATAAADVAAAHGHGGDNGENSSHCIICDDSLIFIAVGACDHPVCSKCALRLRVKSNDKGCPVCRKELPIMVVCKAGYHTRKNSASTATSEVSDEFAVPAFASFDIYSLDVPMPGCDIDALSGLVFVDCRTHCNEMQVLRSIQCPISECRQRMGNHAALNKHVKTAHGQHFCSLCLDHRTLFVSEQVLYDEKTLKKHMNTAPTEGDLLSGHPECQFCKRYHFDAMQLYEHMQLAHCTCPLCPAEHQFRFYQSPESLHKHLKSVHYVCEHCAEIDSSIGPVAFGTATEYASHLAAAHGQHRAPRALLSLASFSGSSRNTDSVFVDLDMSQADPNRSADRRQQGRNSGNNSGNISHFEEPILVPRHMRIAGHVTGSGQFHRSAADEAIERASEEAHARSAAGRLRHGGGMQWEAQGNASFPTLSSGATATATRPKPAAVGTHSLSLVAQQAERIRVQREEQLALEAQRAEAEMRKSMRNQQLAESFGVAAQPVFLQGAPSIASGASTGSTTSSMTVSFADLLRRPLYTPNLITWANKDIHEIVKIERKLEVLIKSPTDSSVQLKPMTAGARAYVHAMARYYGLYSHEFDAEPRRYVSLVKTIDTSIPSVLLSAAALEKPFSMHEGLHKQNLPFLYFQLLNGYFANTHNEGPTNDLSKAGESGRSSSVAGSGNRLWVGGACVAQVVGSLRTCLQGAGVLEDPSMALVAIQPCGPHAVLLELKTVRAANLAFHLLNTEWREWQTRKSSRAAFGTVLPPGSSTVVDEPYVLDLFEIETAFVPGAEGELQRSNQEQANFVAVHAQAAIESNGRSNAAVDAAKLQSRLEEQRRAKQEWQSEIQESWEDSDDNEDENEEKNSKDMLDAQPGTQFASENPTQAQPAERAAPALVPMYAFPWPCLNQASGSNVLNVDAVPYERPARTRRKLYLAPRTLPLPMPAAAAAQDSKDSGNTSSGSGSDIAVWKPSARVLAARNTQPKDRGEALLEAGGALAAEFASQTIQQHRAITSGQNPGKNKATLQAYLDSDSDDDVDADPDKNYFECLIGPDGKIVIPRDKDGNRIKKSDGAPAAVDSVSVLSRRIAEMNVLGVTMQWECTKCTFINDTGGEICEMCQAPMGASQQ